MCDWLKEYNVEKVVLSHTYTRIHTHTHMPANMHSVVSERVSVSVCVCLLRQCFSSGRVC